VLTESFPDGFQLLKDVHVLLMLGMDQLNVLVEAVLNLSDLHVERGSQKDFTLIEHQAKLRELLVELPEFLISLGIEVLDLLFCEIPHIFQVASLFLAHLLRLPHDRFDFKGSILIGSDKVMPCVLQDTDPAKPTHTLRIPTIVFHSLIRVVSTLVGEGLG
jgi:hypothetical protein